MTTTDSLRNVKDRFSEFVDRVDREHERIVVTRNGRPAAVLISPEDLEGLEETLEILSDGAAVKALLEAEAAVASGDVVRGVDAVRGAAPVADSVTLDPYELVVAGPAARAIAEQLPEAVSAAVIDFITGALIENPHRVGRALRNELVGLRSARRGTYRVLYRIDDERREVTVLRVDHRGTAYRPH